MSTHFSRYPDDDGPEQAPCGVWIGDASDLSSDWSRVDCKRCLKWKDTIMATHEAEESAIVQQMGDMADFMKRTAGEHMNDSVSIYKLGIYGKAYDVPGTRRAYTYKHQPDNQGAWRLGEALGIASKAGGGDYIDTGLGLLKQLELKGYGVYELDEAGAPQMEPAHNPEHTLFNEIRTSTPVSEDGEPVRYIITEQQLQCIYGLENTRRIHLEMVSVYAKGCQEIIEGLRAALRSCAKASSAAEVGLIVDGAIAASQAQRALAPENQRVVPTEPLLAKPHPFSLLAADHKGIRVDYSGLLKQSVGALRHGVKEPGLAEMLRQLREHMTELGQRWYRGDTAVVDELLQLYAVEDGARDALKQQGSELAKPAQASRIPAGLYAELEALRTLRDATGVYLQGYMLDEIEDEESCSADQHDAACTVKLALDKARALEWKGVDK